MKKKSKPSKKGFDQKFDAGEAAVDFSKGVVTPGLSKTIKLPPLDIPAWVGAEIERLAQFQANSKASIVRQLLVEGIESRKRRMAS
ncbi:MAG TPA: hypothetical protein VLJ37_11525 [bacterium]|nr:hypothetical protein [bacterium]